MNKITSIGTRGRKRKQVNEEPLAPATFPTQPKRKVGDLISFLKKE